MKKLLVGAVAFVVASMSLVGRCVGRLGAVYQ